MTLANEPDVAAREAIVQKDLGNVLHPIVQHKHSAGTAKIPSVGPIGAALLMMKPPAPEMFRSGRQFAAWIGLTPKDHSTAGKVRLRVITRAGGEGLRSALVVGWNP